jgi:hypothetical protein
MGDVNIPEEAIESAALAQRSPSHKPGPPDPDLVEIWKRTARITLEAAAPLIVAANEPDVWQKAIDLVSNLGMTSMHAAREAVNSAYHSVPEGAVDLAAVSVLEVVRRALIDVRRGANARGSVLRGEGQTNA